MLKWFRQGPSPHQTALAMIGAKAGDHVLVAGSPDPGLVAAVASVTGLNGQTTVAAPSAGREAFDKAAADAGVLIDVIDVVSQRDAGNIAPSAVPAAPINIDVTVLVVNLAAVAEGDRPGLASRALDITRPGGRVIVIDGAKRGGMFGGGGGGTRLDAATIVSTLTAAGAVAARVLAEDAGVAFYEARKAR